MEKLNRDKKYHFFSVSSESSVFSVVSLKIMILYLILFFAGVSAGFMNTLAGLVSYNGKRIVHASMMPYMAWSFPFSIAHALFP